jgi:hypothetical protein
MQPEPDLTAPALRQAEGADLNISPGFQREFQKLSRAGLRRALSERATDPQERTLGALDELMGEVIRIARSRDDDTLQEEHLRLARASICPLWPIC